MLVVLICLFGLLICSCGVLERDNPADPGAERGGQGDAIELVARFPTGFLAGGWERLAAVQYQVIAADMPEPVQGEMNLVGGSAKALVFNVPEGKARMFRVSAFDQDQIPTFAGETILDVEDGMPRKVDLSMARLQGFLDITSELPDEIVSLEVVIAVDGDTLRQTYDGLEVEFNERIADIPTGAGIPILLLGRDADDQILIERTVMEDIRQDLGAHFRLAVEVGTLQITATFPEYLPLVEVDRFSDAAGSFFRRSERPDLPQANEPIDFDDELFLLSGLGPNGEAIDFYHFDEKTKTPAPVYQLVDRVNDPIANQLLIFDVLPGEQGYNDLWQINQVKVLEREYLPNTLNSLEELIDRGFEIMQTEQALNAVIVPAGSKASLRFDKQVPAAPQDGWYRGRIVKYLLFENPSSTDQINLSGGEVQAAQMYGFFENDRDQIKGFALDAQTQLTHNVASVLPGSGGAYSPLWVVQILKLEFFDRVENVLIAGDLASEVENKILPDLRINAPIVRVR
ncbi:MAG: hypothetical protein CME16_02575 [Gemmatimonadetes bacterium]|nr:hypothetical protein [Gemmatimonadota bacterium]